MGNILSWIWVKAPKWAEIQRDEDRLKSYFDAYRGTGIPSYNRGIHKVPTSKDWPWSDPRAISGWWSENGNYFRYMVVPCCTRCTNFSVACTPVRVCWVPQRDLTPRFCRIPIFVGWVPSSSQSCFVVCRKLVVPKVICREMKQSRQTLIFGF
jgi:hypothetical protein